MVLRVFTDWGEVKFDALVLGKYVYKKQDYLEKVSFCIYNPAS